MRRAYSEVKRARLTQVEDAFDPDNVFHLNHNTKPHRPRGSPGGGAPAWL